MKQLTLVTCLYDLVKRGSPNHRTVDWMLDNAAYVLGQDRELVIFTDPDPALVAALLERRGDLPTKIVEVPLEELLRPDRAAAVAQGSLQSNARRTKVTVPFVQLMWSKYAMLERALEGADGSHLGWIDLGITHVGKHPPDGVDVFADPSDKPRVHALRIFSKADVVRPDYWRAVHGHLAGGLVVGARDGVRALVADFWCAADRAISMGLSPLDEGLLSYVVGQRPDDFSYSYGDYEDILHNHDTPRGGEPHRAWIVSDARSRGLSGIMGGPPPPPRYVHDPAVRYTMDLAPTNDYEALMSPRTLMPPEHLPVYCLSFAGSERRSRMEARFAAVQVSCVYIDPISADAAKTDVTAAGREHNLQIPADFHFWATAIMQGHLKMIRAFVETSAAPYGVFCEDDIHIRRTFAIDLLKMVEAFEQKSLDVLLLGYLLPHKEGSAGDSFSFHDFGDDLWGAQMYMLSRSFAQRLLETYDLAYALKRRSSDVPFAADWTITKLGRRARAVPMLAVEEGDVVTSDEGQRSFHRRCFEAQYDDAYYTALSIPSPPQRLAADEKTTLLGLVMIVKDEAHGIIETLKSFAPYIDYWTIMDTGSTDNTADLVRAALRDVPGELISGPFVDFSTTRNQALAHHGEKTRWTLMPDADDCLVGGKELRKQLPSDNSGPDGFMMNIRRGHLDYYLPLVLRSSKKLRYVGRVHEHVDRLVDQKLVGVEVCQNPPVQSREASEKRWQRDAKLLEEDLKAHPNNARTLFYLAQTYECINQKTEAIDLYRKRIAVGGWIDETFEAHLRLAGIHRALHAHAEADHWLLKAHNFMPERAEPLLKLAQHYRSKDNHALAFLFADRGASMPITSSTLFVDHGAQNECSYIAGIHGYYLKDTQARRAGALHARSCVRRDPDNNNFRSNWAFYAQDVKTAFGATARRIDFAPPSGWNASNPSVHYDGVDGRLRCVARTTNYKIVDGHYLTPADNVIYTRNWMLELSDDLETTHAVEMVDRTDIPRSSYPVHGFEDCRLYRVGERLMCSATVCDFDLDKPSEGPREIVAMQLSREYEIESARPIRGPWSARAQKNWMPFEQCDREEWLYASINAEGEATHISSEQPPASLDSGRLRGGSQLVKLPDGNWLAIVHDVAFPGGRSRFYLHRFVMFDAEAKRVVAMTDPFYFEKLGIEFCCGLARLDDRLIASFSVDDASANLAVFGLKDVLAAMQSDFVV